MSEDELISEELDPNLVKAGSIIHLNSNEIERWVSGIRSISDKFACKDFLVYDTLDNTVNHRFQTSIEPCKLEKHERCIAEWDYSSDDNQPEFKKRGDEYVKVLTERLANVLKNDIVKQKEDSNENKQAIKRSL